MTLYGPWAILEIAPTDDERAVKRAYAAKLKSIDQHGDPQAFMQLRAAFEQARQHARYAQINSADDVEDSDEEADEVAIGEWDDDGVANDIATTAELSEAPASGSEPATAMLDTDASDAIATVNAGLHDLANVIFGDAESPVDEAALERTFDALLVLPAMENLQIAGQVEYQLAHMACQAQDRTLLLAQMARYQFNWQDRVRGYDADGVFVAAEELGMVSQFFRRYQRDHYDDYREKLRAEEFAWFNAGPDGLKKAEKKRVTQFLSSLETHHPQVVPYLDKDRMQVWGDAGFLPKLETTGSGSSGEGGAGRWIWFAIFILFALSRLASLGERSQEPQPPAYGEEQRQEEFRRSIEHYMKDPKTQEMLERAREKARNNGDQNTQLPQVPELPLESPPSPVPRP